MMVRTQIVLDSETQKLAQLRAAELDISFAEYMRRLVERDLGEPSPQTNPSAIFDLGHSGGTDVGREKDRLLGEAIQAVNLD